MGMGTSETKAQGQGAEKRMGTSNGESRSQGQVEVQMATSRVRMVKDSISDRGIRLCTLHLRYWRPIHSELMTHRVFSRNARSSRAVPVATLLKEQIFIPQFGLNQRGMQAKEDAPPELQAKWAHEWEELAEITRDYVRRWGEEGMHKQHANRPLEWFGWIDVLVSSTCWENFWALRIDTGAQPELQTLAAQMKICMEESEPQLLLPGEWHLPYVLEEEENLRLELRLQLSTARCARLSYRPFDGNADMDAEQRRFNQLVVSQPVHASPAEHQATPDTEINYVGVVQGKKRWQAEELHGNFVGWVQHRKCLPNESVPDAY